LEERAGMAGVWLGKKRRYYLISAAIWGLSKSLLYLGVW
jgi:hypothetical protein